MNKGPYKMKAGEEGPMQKNYGPMLMKSPMKDDYRTELLKKQDEKLANEKKVFGGKKPEFTNTKNAQGEDLSVPNIKNMKYNKSREDYINKAYKIIGNKK